MKETICTIAGIVGCSGVGGHRLALEYMLTQKILMKIILYVYMLLVAKLPLVRLYTLQ